MKIKKGQVIELDVSEVAFGGNGLTRVDGFTVFVDQAVAGDRVLARIGKKKKNYAEARMVQLLNPSSARVKAPCPYSGFCGGCKWQFLDYDQQIRYKRQHVSDALEHIGGIFGIPVHATAASEKIFEYRNKMEFSFAPRRWLLPHELGCPEIEADMALGLHVPGTFNKILDIEACLLQPEPGNQMVSLVREYVKASPLPVYDLRTHQGFWRFLVLRHSVDRDCWMVNIVTSEENGAQLRPLADLLIQAHPQVVSVVNNITARKAGVAIGEREILLAGEPRIIDRIGPFEFELSANSFFQTNTRGARRLYDTVKAFAGLSGSQTVLDLYCGTGTIAIYLAPAAGQVIGMELAPGAIVDARENCRRNRIENCRFIAGDIRRELPHVTVRPDVMIIDPPRSGMHPDVVRQVLAMAPPKIVYVSCNPATMARDMVMMKDAYHVMEVQPVDMFPHTFHIESVARLTRK